MFGVRMLLTGLGVWNALFKGRADTEPVCEVSFCFGFTLGKVFAWPTVTGAGVVAFLVAPSKSK